MFPDKAMTVAAVDRLAHHATILEMNHALRCRQIVDAGHTTRLQKKTAGVDRPFSVNHATFRCRGARSLGAGASRFPSFARAARISSAFSLRIRFFSESANRLRT